MYVLGEINKIVDEVKKSKKYAGETVKIPIPTLTHMMLMLKKFFFLPLYDSNCSIIFF